MGYLTQRRAQDIGKEQGLLELILMYGTTFPAGELSKRAKEFGIPEHMLARIAEPIFAKPEAFQQRISPITPQAGAQPTPSAGKVGAAEIAGYRIKSQEERQRETAQRQALQTARLGLQTAPMEAQKEALIAGAVKSAEQVAVLGKETAVEKLKSTHAKELELLKQQGASNTRFAVANFNHWLQTERIELQDRLRRTPTKLEKEKIESEIGENIAQTKYANALTLYIKSGKGQPERELNELWKRLGTLGFLRKPKTGQVPEMKPLVMGSDDYKKAVGIFNALGISFEEVNAGRTWMGVPKISKQKVLLIPIKRDQISPRLSPRINLPDPLGYYQ